MRKFWVAYKNKTNPMNVIVVVLQENEKANATTFYRILKQRYENDHLQGFDHWNERNIISWSLIEE